MTVHTHVLGCVSLCVCLSAQSAECCLTHIYTPFKKQVQHFHYEDEASPIFQLETFGFRKGQSLRRSGSLV